MKGLAISFIVGILGLSLVGFGHLSGSQSGTDNTWFKNFWGNDQNWYKTFWGYFDIKKITGFMNSGGSHDDDDHNVNQSPIDDAKVSFNIVPRVVTDKGQKYFQNVVSECLFSSMDTFNPLCVRCKILDMSGKIIGKGEVFDPRRTYHPPEKIIIPLFSEPAVGPNDPAFNIVNQLSSVKLSVCAPKCDCKERKDDHKSHYDYFSKYYADHKNTFSKSSYKNYMEDFRGYLNSNKEGFDKADFKQYTDYYRNFLDQHKKDFDKGDWDKYNKEEKDDEKEQSHHEDKCDCDNNHHDKSGFFTGGGKVYVPKTGGTTTLTHGFELHCDETQAPNNLEINWQGHQFHLEQLKTVDCMDDGTHNEPPPSPHPGPTLDIYTGTGYGRYDGVCGAYATWQMSDNGEPGKNDQIISLQIKDKNSNVVMNIGSPLNLQTGNHQFVPHPASHPNPPTKTTPCPLVP